MNEWVLISLVIFIEAFLHYFPWKLILKSELPRLVAYALGVLGLMVPFTVWLVEEQLIQAAVTLWAVIVSGGLSVALLYWLDDWLFHRQGKKDAEEREQVAVEAIKELASGTGK